MKPVLISSLLQYLYLQTQFRFKENTSQPKYVVRNYSLKRLQTRVSELHENDIKF
jgi:hypothetical protein